MNELTLDAKVVNLNRVLDFVNGFLDRVGCTPRMKAVIDVSVEELFVNIASYAYATKAGSATIQVETETEPPTVSITFLDCGIPYNPLAKPDPDTTLPAEKRRIGGLGIYMVKKSMDSMTYERINGQNVLTIRKCLL